MRVLLHGHRHVRRPEVVGGGTQGVVVGGGDDTFLCWVVSRWQLRVRLDWVSRWQLRVRLDGVSRWQLRVRLSPEALRVAQVEHSQPVRGGAQCGETAPAQLGT